MGNLVSRQDESNLALWLATWAGKMEPSCPPGTTRCVPQEKFPQKLYNKSSFDQVYLVKTARYWPHSFLRVLWTWTLSRSINTQKKRAILTSHLDNNPYPLVLFCLELALIQRRLLSCVHQAPCCLSRLLHWYKNDFSWRFFVKSLALFKALFRVICDHYPSVMPNRTTSKSLMDSYGAWVRKKFLVH